MKDKYKPAELPSVDEAWRLAFERDGWAETSRQQDMFGSAYEFELCALLLRFYANTLEKLNVERWPP